MSYTTTNNVVINKLTVEQYKTLKANNEVNANEVYSLSDVDNYLFAEIPKVNPRSWNWSIVGSNELYNIKYINGEYVAVGTDKTIYTSTDLETWVSKSSALPSSYSGSINNVIYFNDKYIFGGNSYLLIGDFTGLTSVYISGYAEALACSDSIAIACTSNSIIKYSTNGTSWSMATVNSSAALNSACYGNGVFIVVGNSGTILRSTDGMNFEVITSPTTTHLYGVNYCNGKFIAVGMNSEIVTSTDGITWELGHFYSEYNRTCTDIIYVDGYYVAIGFGPNVYISTDLINWEIVATNITGGFNKVCYNDNKLVAVGRYGNLGVTNYMQGTLQDVVDYFKSKLE